MESIIEQEKRIPVIANVDVLVCGGGAAGVGSAVSAARSGCDVLLLERYGFLGGMVTAGLVITTPPLNNGINIDVARRLKKAEVYAPCRNLSEEAKPLQMHAMDPEIIKFELFQMLKDDNVKFLLHTYVADVIVEDDIIKGVIIESKSGRQAILAKVVVDATGDADVAAYAKVPFVISEKILPLTLMFNMVGVDTATALKKIGTWGHLREFVRRGIEAGELSFDLGLTARTNAPGVTAMNLIYPDEVSVWGGNLDHIDALSNEDLTKAEVITREHAMRLSYFLRKNLPGFENARIEYSATQVGIRDTRRIVGERSPSLKELVTSKDDTVAKPYGHNEIRVPFGSILPKKIENLLVAGRCISAEDDAMVQLRLIPPCFATGQAAGTAAALAMKERVAPRKLDVSLIQKTLSEQEMEFSL